MNVQYPTQQGAANGVALESPTFTEFYTSPDIISLLQQRITNLEAELKQYKSAAQKGGRMLKLMWGHSFDEDCLF